MWRRFEKYLRTFFTCSYAESRGVIFFLLLSLVFFLLPSVWKLYRTIYYQTILAKEDQKMLHDKLAILEKRELSIQSSDLQKKDFHQATEEILREVCHIHGWMAKRIISYRDALGGFISLDQIKEVYGCNEKIEKSIKEHFCIAESYSPKKISLNHATYKELIRHPYMSTSITIDILRYRKKNKLFQSIQELGFLLKDRPIETYNRLLPYLSL